MFTRAPSVAPPEAPAPKVPALDRRYVTAALMMVMVLASMEQTVTSTAMPTIIGELHGLERYSWVASIYLLACTVSMPLYGRLADALGRKWVILTAIFIFCISSVLAASAMTMGQLILYRGLQGLGAGGIMPVVLTILGDIFTLEERAKIQGFFSAVWGTSSLAGPALGAFLVNTLGWRSIFFVNLPFGLLALIVIWWKYHDREKGHSTDLDIAGIGLMAVGCTTLLMLVSRMGPEGWPLPTAITLAAVTVVAVIAFVWHELRTAHPVLPPNLVVRRAIGPALIGSALLGEAFLSLDTYVPLYVQGGRGGGATAAASVVTPVMLTWAISGVIAAPLVVRWGFRKTAVLGAVLVSVGFTGLVACVLLSAPHWLLTAVLALTGFGFGPASMSYLLSAQDAVAWQQRGIITSSVQFFRTIGGAVGIGVLGAVFNMLAQPKLAKLDTAGVGRAALLDPKTRAHLPPAAVASIQHIMCDSLLWVFAAMLIASAAGIAISFLMSGKKTGHQPTAAEALEAMG